MSTYHGDRKYTYNSVPPEVREALDTLMDDLECSDNYRFTPQQDNEGMQQYEDIKEAGCCGRVDTNV